MTNAPSTNPESSSADSGAGRGTALVVEHVEWDDPRAAALRTAMNVEMEARYTDPGVVEAPGVAEARDRALAVDPSTVYVTVLISNAAGTPVAHAGLRDLDGEWELKKVIVDAHSRGLGLGGMLMDEIERVARAGGAERIILQTGDRQPEAVRVYERHGYTRIPVYEPYVTTIPSAICFEKVLATPTAATTTAPTAATTTAPTAATTTAPSAD